MQEHKIQSDDDIYDILRIAVRETNSEDNTLRQRLLLSAAELGISEQQLEAAEQKWAREKQEREAQREFDIRVRRDWASHFFTYLIVNAGLLGLDFWRDGRISWSLWPLFGWGIGVAIHTLTMFVKDSDYHKELQQFKEEKIREALRGRE